MKAEFEHTYRDRLTGFTGTAIGRAEYLADTPTVQLTRADKDGKPETVWIAELRLEEVNETRAPGGFG
jgi:hypothetical protein